MERDTEGSAESGGGESEKRGGGGGSDGRDDESGDRSSPVEAESSSGARYTQLLFPLLIL